LGHEAVQARPCALNHRKHEMVGLNFWETEAFLKQKQAYLPYDESDLERDRQAIAQALSE
jgi:hypothetical protein